MTSFVAFLRGVNLGKRQTKSADLKAVFESLGLNGVRTLIASGNVLFEAAAEAALKDRIETALEARFGFAVGVVLRRLEDIRKMVAARPFAGVPPDADVNRYVLFVEPPMEPLPRLVDAPSDWEVAGITPGEIFLIGHRRPNGRYSEGLDDLGKQLPKGLLTTMRNWNTIEKAAAI